ncbi:MAG: beta-ketoacyl synthase [Cellvibrionales bacterium]|nr:beta-ketoacyl synthase [Cellvibrionales bacterium]
MAILPVITGFGGISPAGRSVFHHAYQRLVFDALTTEKKAETLKSLSALMGDHYKTEQGVLDNTLIRKIHKGTFDAQSVTWNKRFPVSMEQPLTFQTKNIGLPDVIPENWTVTPLEGRMSQVTIHDNQDFMLPDQRVMAVNSAGQLPTGFDAAKLYQAKNHPKGIQMTVFGASDAIQMMGIDWDLIRSKVPADQVSVYAGSGMSQLDPNGNGGMMSARQMGKKVTSKQCPFGFAEMPADFINAYLLGSLGTTGTNMGACASFLYNLRQGVMDIQSGRSQIAIVGNAEAPILPEIIDGYSAMGALATDDELRQLDGLSADEAVNHRRACRPFSTNKGFTLGESAQFIVLMSDQLAMALGATIYGAVSDVFINADGFKKSISAPGVGNYITVAKSMAAARAIIGDRALRDRTFIQAHGTGTPQNRVTESHILNDVAKAFGAEQWLVGAVKSYLGHSIGCAAGDQIVSSLGIWDQGIFPGVTSIDHIADDVYHDSLHIPMQHLDVGANSLDIGIINAKGFGGNNASATLLSPHLTHAMLAKKHGRAGYAAYQKANVPVQEASEYFKEKTLSGEAEVIYQFDHNVCVDEDVSVSKECLSIDKAKVDVSLEVESPYAAYID